MSEISTLPNDFLIGTATAAYQNEGAAFEDGKGLSIWDDFTHTKGKVVDGTNGDIACDQYHRYKEDIALMKEMGNNTYRFSVSWPRIFPEGIGKINPKGFDFYDRLIDELLENGIEPCVTLYHWDLPLALENKGGWTRRETAYEFGNYAETVVKRLGDRTEYFITINEIFSVVIGAYLMGMHPPCKRSISKALRALHHLLLAHGISMQRIKAACPNIKAGICHVAAPAYPYRPEDQIAADRAYAILFRSFMDPVYKGSYPKETEKLFNIFFPSMQQSDLEIISQPTDILGVNYYQRGLIKKSPIPFLAFTITKPDYPGVKFSSKGWEFFPQGLYDILMRIKDEYGNPEVYVTENGVALDDVVVDGQVHDPDRIEYLRTHLASVCQACREGANVKGYYIWSLTDNFDWEQGQKARFGLVYLDFETQQRIIKDSGRWLKQVCLTKQFTF